MKLLCDPKDLETNNWYDMVPLQCGFCTETFHRQNKWIKSVYKRNTDQYQYCSKTCAFKAKVRDRNVSVICRQCFSSFIKNITELTTSGNNFCSHSCSAKYHNAHKTTGQRRSKLEVWLETELQRLYPAIVFEFNQTPAINAELDIYIPELKLAVELNGIFHYEPIFGQEKFEKTKTNDTRKFQACIEKGIELLIIDVTGQKYFKPQNSQKYLDIITNIIDTKLSTPKR